MSEAVKAAWGKLEQLAKPTLQALFADPARLDLLSARLELPGGAIRFDWSKTHLDAAHAAAVGLSLEAGTAVPVAAWELLTQICLLQHLVGLLLFLLLGELGEGAIPGGCR